MNAIKCRNVTKSFVKTDDAGKVISIFKKRRKKAAVGDVTFFAVKGEIFGVMGQSAPANPPL